VDTVFTPGSALIVIDMQHDFVDSPFGVKGGAAIVPAVRNAVIAARRMGVPVIFTTHLYDPDHPKVKDVVGRKYLIRGTQGGELVSDLRRGDEPVFDKTEYSAFTSSQRETQTSLTEYLREQKVNKVVLAGLALDYCVRATALDSANAGLKAVVLRDATKGYGDDGETLRELTAAQIPSF
jgi:nicotinamidase/pyrazinamidase